MLKKGVTFWAVLFLLIGVLGFIPGITSTNDSGMKELLGLFMVGTVHNIIHLLSGGAAWLSRGSESAARNYLRVFGVVYALVAVIGFIQGDTVLGIIDVNSADNWLHVAFALGLLYGGFVVKEGAPAAKPAPAATGSDSAS